MWKAFKRFIGMRYYVCGKRPYEIMGETWYTQIKEGPDFKSVMRDVSDQMNRLGQGRSYWVEDEQGNVIYGYPRFGPLDLEEVARQDAIMANAGKQNNP